MIDALVIFALAFAAQNKLAPLLAAGGWLLPKTHPIFAPLTAPTPEGGGRWKVEHIGLDGLIGRGTTPEEANAAAERELAMMIRDTGGLRVWLSRLLACAFCTGFHAGWAWAVLSMDVPALTAGCWALVVVVSVVNGSAPGAGAAWRARWAALIVAGLAVAALATGGLTLLRWAFLGSAVAYVLDAATAALERSGGAWARLKAQVDEIDQAVAELEDDRGA